MSFYQKKYPDVGDLVMVNVTRIVDDNVYVELLEYDNIEGLIPGNEVSRRRNFKISENSMHCCAVIFVDTVKGFIDLSKKRVNGEDYNNHMKIFLKAKTINGILKNVSMKSEKSIEYLYENTVWDDTTIIKTSLDEQTNQILMDEYNRRIKEPSFNIKRKLELYCFTKDGVLTIIEALKLCKKYDIIAKTIDAPFYMLQLETKNEKDGIDAMDKCVEEIRQFMINNGGTMNDKK